MGYSIMTPFTNEESKQKMQNFLNKEFKTFNQLIKNSNDNQTPSDDMNFSNKFTKPVLGFNYNASSTDEERNYYFSICYFMAIHNGDKEHFDILNHKQYIIYDGIEKWPLFINEEVPKNYHGDYSKINEIGFRENFEIKQIQSNKFLKLSGKKHLKELKRIDEIIKTELQRLSNKWNTNYL